VSYQDRVKDTSVTGGTGNLTVSGTPPVGYVAFGSVYTANGDSFTYVADDFAGNWEVGLGHLSGATTIVRDIVYDSSNAGALVNFPATQKYVWVDYVASDVLSMTVGTACRMGFAIQ
jgi:hypothetical protein